MKFTPLNTYVKGRVFLQVYYNTICLAETCAIHEKSGKIFAMVMGIDAFKTKNEGEIRKMMIMCKDLFIASFVI